MPPLRTRLRQLIRRTGYDLSRHLPTVPDLLRQRHVDVVFDVGANVGQYGSMLRDWGYRGRIVSFEPLAAAYADLAQRAARDGAWIAHPFALGASETSADLHVSDLSVFSSLRAPLEAALAYDVRAATVAVESVAVRRLDAVFEAHCAPGERAFLKVDTQGYEADVLDGGSGVLDRFDGIQLELSTRQWYEGEALADVMISRMAALGFVLGQIAPVAYDPHEGSTTLLQIDAIFVRPQSG